MATHNLSLFALSLDRRHRLEDIPAYIIFGLFCLAMAVYIFFTHPETAGRTLEEIYIVFNRDNLPRKSCRLALDTFQEGLGRGKQKKCARLRMIEYRRWRFED